MIHGCVRRLMLAVSVVFAAASARAEDTKPPTPPAITAPAPESQARLARNMMVMKSFGHDDLAVFTLDSLPLGPARRFVLSVPVGGIDSLAPSEGWKMERFFKLTDDQTKAVATLREAYKQDQKNLEEELRRSQQAFAEKAILLRRQYEQKANDLLAGGDKETKTKIDTLLQDFRARCVQLAADTVAAYDMSDRQQSGAGSRALMDKIGMGVAATRASVVALLPAETRRIAEVFYKQQDQEQEHRDANRRELEARQRERGEPVKPPKPPDDF